MMQPATVPAFDQFVTPGGYAWWYLDAISDDGRHGLTLIAFIGSVFSPYYARARARGISDPLAHCAINVALYGPGGRWSMTERGRAALVRDKTSLVIGPSALRAGNDGLTIELSEWTVPIPRRLRGRVRVYPKVCHNEAIDLDPQGRHRWTPVWPAARVEVELERPDQRWSGSGYLDHNTGSEALQNGFESWSWLRADTSRGPVVLYDTQRRDGERASLALLFDRSGERHDLASPPAVALAHGRWGVARPTRSEDGNARIESVWEDTPFYTRSRVATRLLGERVTAVHESLCLNRFASPWVQLLLPFRMPRRSSWKRPGALD